MKYKTNLPLLIILFFTIILRFFNLMHDSPHFFNPDERNMAIAITRFTLPAKLSKIPSCLISEFFNKKNPTTNDQQLMTGCSFNPHFFAYGQFPLYLAFASDSLIRGGLAVLQGLPLDNFLSTSFPSAIFWLRFWSALSSILSVLMVYFITKQLLANQTINPPITNYQLPITASLMAAFTPGLIQAAHFGTTESLLTFFFLVSIYLSMKISANLSKINSPKYPASAGSNLWRDLILLSLTIGLAIGSKLTGVFFLIPPFTALIINFIKSLSLTRQKKIFLFGNINQNNALIRTLTVGLLLLWGILLFYIISSPYNLMEPENFRSAVFGYERDVAMGKYEAFYTRQFINTTPILFQMKKIFPYTLGWPLFILGSIGFLLMNIQLFIQIILSILSKIQSSKIKAQLKSKAQRSNIFVIWILLFGFWIYFIPNSSLFAKWTRFMTPIMPFFSIFSAYTMYSIYKMIPGFEVKVQSSKFKVQNQLSNLKNFKFLAVVLSFAFCVLSLSPGLAFMSIYAREDSRVTASKWIYNNIPSNSYVLSETANVIDIPMGIEGYEAMKKWNNVKVISFDFYHMDENPKLFADLLNHLEKADYIFIPSRRIFKNYTLHPQRYKLVTKYYQLLFSGKLGYEKVAEISSYPSLYLGPFNWQFPDEDAEETYTVFDHPVVRIFRKISPYSRDEYSILFES